MHRLMRIAGLAAACLLVIGYWLLAASPCLAQMTTVTASSIGGAGNLVSGTMYLQPVVAARVGTAGGQVLGVPYTAAVTGGAVSVNVPDAEAASPNTCYAITILDSVTLNVDIGSGLAADGVHVQQGGPYGCVQPTGSVWSFDAYQPNSTTVTPSPTGGTITGAITFNGPVTFGASVSVPSSVTTALFPGVSSNGSNGLNIAGNLDSAVIDGIQSPEYVTTAHPPLAFWDAVFHNCQNQIVNVFVHGDSRSIVDTTVESGGAPSIAVTFGNKWVDQLRAQLQTACGSAGTGLIPFRWGTGSLASQGLNQDYYAGASGSVVATDKTLGPYQPNTNDPMLITANVNGTAIPFTARQSFTNLVEYCVSGPGLHAWTMTVDGSTVGSCGGTGGSETAVRVVSSAVAMGPHSASVSCPTQPCEAYGLEATGAATGVEVHNLSEGGGSAEIFGMYPSTQFAFSDLIPAGLALDIIYEISNEPGQGYSTTQFQTSLNNIVSHEISAHTYAPSFLIVSPLQDGIAGQAPYYPILAATAAAQNTAFVDLRDRWGTATAPSYLFGSDGFHEDNMGNGEVYSAVSATLIDVYPSPNDHVFSNPVSNSAGMEFALYGANDFYLSGWGIGNTGLVGALGLFDYTTGTFPWSTNATDDLYGATPLSGGNVAAGVGAKWGITHLGAATFTAVGAPFFNGTGTPTFTMGAAAQVGSGGSYAAAACSSGWTCTNKKGIFVFTTGGGTLSAGVDVTLNWSATAPDLQVCSFWFNSIPLNAPLGPGLYNSTTSASQFGTVTAGLTANTSYAVLYSCQ